MDRAAACRRANFVCEKAKVLMTSKATYDAISYIIVLITAQADYKTYEIRRPRLPLDKFSVNFTCVRCCQEPQELKGKWLVLQDNSFDFVQCTQTNVLAGELHVPVLSDLTSVHPTGATDGSPHLCD